MGTWRAFYPLRGTIGPFVAVCRQMDNDEVMSFCDGRAGAVERLLTDGAIAAADAEAFVTVRRRILYCLITCLALVKAGRATVDRSKTGWCAWEMAFGLDGVMSLPEDLQRKIIGMV